MKKIFFVLSLSAAVLNGGEMQIPDRWQPVKIAGLPFRVGMIPRNYVINDPQMMKMPLHRDAIWDIRRTDSHRIDFIGKIMKTPKSHNAAALLKSSNPLMIHTTCYYTEKEKDVAIPEASWRAFRNAAGDRILGTLAAECIQSFEVSKKRYHLPEPGTRQEAYELLRQTWNCKTMSQFRDLSVFYNWGLPRYAGTATYFDHMLLEFGAGCAGHECGCGIEDMPMQFAVSRGAARQYGTFFYCFNATHNRTLRYPGQVNTGNWRSYSHRDYEFLTPAERRTQYSPPRLTGHKPKMWHIYSNRGPECGIPDSEYRRRFIYAFFGGAGIYRDESCVALMYALYDYKTIDKEDPLAVNLRDRKYHISKTGSLLADFYDRIATRIDRGAVCTPIALVWDRYHGYAPNYGAAQPWNNRFPQPGDKMFASLEAYLFPVSPLTHENKCHRTSPFGDIFDVITNDASQEAMDAYPALLLTGDVSMEKGFDDRLTRYLRNGGTLIASRCQIKDLNGLPAVPEKTGVSEIAVGKGKLILSSRDYWLDNQKISGELGGVIRKIAAEQLPVAVEGDIQYMVNRTRDSVIISLFNNYSSDLDRTWENPEPAPDPSTTRKVVVTLKKPASEARELLSGKILPVRNLQIETVVSGGDVQIICVDLKKKPRESQLK